MGGWGGGVWGPTIVSSLGPQITLIRLCHNHLLFSHIILSDSDGGGGSKKCDILLGVQDL